MAENKIAELIGRAYAERRPVTAQFELTYKCNLLCSFCYNAPVARPELDGDGWIEALDKCRAAGSYNVILTGGEPMVHRDFWRIAEAVRERGMVLKTYTNGVLLADPDKAQRYADLAPFDTEISLHGARAEVHDRLTGIRGSFDKLIVALGNLARVGVKVTLKTPITRLNQHELREVEALAGRFGYGVTFDTNILPTDDGDMNPLSLAPDPDVLAQFFVDKVRRGERTLAPRPVEKMKHNCGVGRTVLTIDPYGEIYPCIAFRRSLGNILEIDDLDALWQGRDGRRSEVLDYVRTIADEVPRRTLVPHEEGGFASFCPGVAERETGDPYAYYETARTSGLIKLKAYRAVRGEAPAKGAGNRVAPDRGTA